MTPASDPFRDRSAPDAMPSGRWGWKIALAGALTLFAGIVLLSGEIARRETAGRLAAEANAGLPLALAALRSELEKQRSLPQILSQDVAIRALLSAPVPDVAALDAANERLRDLAGATRAAVIYLLDAQGLTIAASNYREPTSFVGSDYRFRRYYEGAIEDGAAEQYALGTVSNRPGVYFSRRVDEASGAGIGLGVVVVKVELDAVEQDWREAGRPVYVTDPRGIVLATTEPSWRFHTLAPIDAATAADIRDSLQFGEAPLLPLPLAAAGEVGGVPLVSATRKGVAQGYVGASAPVDGGLAGWRLTLLVPADRALLAAAGLAQVVAGLVLAILALSVAALVYRARRGRRRFDEQMRAAERLELRVAERTMELTEANGRLQSEMAEREKAEARILDLREDLIQANRLASLGQITAGVAHEINQPLAAIRLYAENAGRFLARDDAVAAGANMETVIGLTERIGTITETLRGFARRATGPVEALAIAQPIEGAMLILKSRLTGSGVALDIAGNAVDPALLVYGNRIRLEQVLVNLLRNALEALSQTANPRISLRIEASGEEVLVHVLDNGPGIAPEIVRKLFTPFSTSKPKGLGLGLVISSDIVAELGGALSALSVPGEGAHFVMRLRRALNPETS